MLRRQESLSVVTDYKQFKQSPINSLVMLKKVKLRLEDQSDFPINILEFVQEDHLVERVLKLGTISNWLFTKGILT